MLRGGVLRCRYLGRKGRKIHTGSIGCVDIQSRWVVTILLVCNIWFYIPNHLITLQGGRKKAAEKRYEIDGGLKA